MYWGECIVNFRREEYEIRSKHLTPPHIFEAVEGIVEVVPNHRKVSLRARQKLRARRAKSRSGREGGWKENRERRNE